MNNEKWKEELIASAEESIRFFSNENRLEREKFVVNELLTAIGVEFDPDELTSADEPIDIKFRDSGFQIKEVMQPGRRRGDELKHRIVKYRDAKSYDDLIESYAQIDTSLEQIVDECVARSNALLIKYGPIERQRLDLLCYHNYLDVSEINSNFNTPATQEFRSLSIVSNRFRLVVYASSNSAPDYLISNVGVVHERNPLE